MVNHILARAILILITASTTILMDERPAIAYSIVAWGDNWAGQCNTPSPNTGFKAIAAGYSHSLGLKNDGSIVAWGSNDSGQCVVPSPNTGFTAIAAGGFHSLGLKADGSVVAWGRNNEGQCNVPLPNIGFVAVAAGTHHCLGLKNDGSIVAWGWNGHGQLNVPWPNTGFIAVDCGDGHGLGLKADGSIVAWGGNWAGQCDVPSPNTGFKAIAAGYAQSLGLKNDGSIVAWGINAHGQLDVPLPNTSFTAIAAGIEHSLGLKIDGSVVAWGWNEYGQCTVPLPNTGFKAISARSHSLALKEEAPTTVTIQGTVYNIASNTPIAGADVTANGETVQTDSSGQYQITGLSPGDIIITVNKAGYVQNSTIKSCPEPGKTYQVNFLLYADVELIGLEVVQTVQNWQNDVPLIEGKKTYVRAHVKSKSNPPMSVKAGLRVKRNGEILQSEQNFVATCTAEPDPQRQWSNSLNFELKPEWCSGTLELTVIGEGIECSEAAGPIAGDCSAQVTFVPSPKLKIVVFAAPWRGLDMQLHTVDSTELMKAGAALLNIYPINNLDSLDIKTDSLPAVGPIIPIGDLFKLETNKNLDIKRSLDCWQSGECSSLYYGVTPDIHAGGEASFSGWVASGEAARYIMAHELGHCLGRPHTVWWRIPWPGGPFGLWGPCGELALTAEEFPYRYNVNGQLRATIGPMDLGENRLIYGLDTSLPTPNVQDPNHNFELMSYCDISSRWISDWTYEKILNGINTKFSSSNRMQHAKSRTSETQCYLVVRGVVNLDSNTAELSPFTYISNPIVVPSEPNIGDYTLELLDGSDHLILSVNFQPMEYTVDASEDSRFGSFIIPVPADPNIKQAIVIHDANVIGSVTASNNPPTVQVLFPNGGEVFDGNQLTIEWVGNDLDGDKLTYVVYYSSDGGGTWKTIAVDWPDTNLTIERKFITATNMGLIRVIASDGFNTATDESDSVFTVLNNAPEVVLFQPKTNAFFDANQLMVFEASALDREDGRLADSNLVWTSSIDGSLGTGSVLTWDSNSLSRGYHTITVTATDSGGLTASASVNIWVRITPADLNGNSKVDFIDYAILANQWQLPPDTPSADIAPLPTGDGIVNLQDLALMAEHWLECHALDCVQ